MADQFDLNNLTDAEWEQLARARLGGAGGVGAGPTLGNNGPRRGGGGTRRQASYDASINDMRVIYKNLGVRAPTIAQSEKAEIRQALGRIRSAQGRAEARAYSSTDGSYEQRFASTINYLGELAEYEPGRMYHEREARISDSDLTHMGERSGSDAIVRELSSLIHTIPGDKMSPEARRSRIAEISALRSPSRGGFSALSQLRGDVHSYAYSLYDGDYAALFTQDMGDGFPPYTPEHIQRYQQAPAAKRARNRSIFTDYDSSTLQQLVAQGNVGAGRALLGRNMKANGLSQATQDFFNAEAKTFKTTVGLAYLEQQITDDSPDEMRKNPIIGKQLRLMDTIAHRTQGSTVIEQFASYFNYMTTQGMRRGTFRFIANELAPAIKATMGAEGVGLGGALVGNMPLLALAGAGFAAAGGIGLSNLMATASSASLAMGPGQGGSLRGLDLFTRSFLVGQSPQEFTQSLRGLSLTETGGISTMNRAFKVGQVANAAGISTQAAVEMMNTLGRLGASESQQNTLMNYAGGGANNSSSAQARAMLGLYTSLNLLPSSAQMLSNSTVLHENPILGSLLPTIAGTMGDADSAYMLAALTGKEPSALYNDPMETADSIMRLFGKGGQFDLGTNIGPLMSKSFGIGPGLYGLIQSGQGDALGKALGARPTVSPDQELQGRMRAQARTQAGNISGNQNPLARLMAVMSGENMTDAFKYVAGKQQEALGFQYLDPNMAMDPDTGKYLSSESPEQVADLAFKMGFRPSNTDAVADPGNNSDQMVNLLREIRDIESSKSTSAVKLDVHEPGGTTSSPPLIATPTPTGR